MSEPKPYMPYVAYAMDDFRARAAIARMDATTLITRAEIWEDAARKIEQALDKEKRAQSEREQP
jgi:hypothetical protein